MSFFASLPAERQEDLQTSLSSLRARELDAVIVLDDDPTGTQTVHGIPVLTSWSQRDIEKELERGTTLFFILTNSRSLDAGPAEELAYNIGRNISGAAASKGKRCWVISRSDSTLRGHYPGEVNALELGLQIDRAIHFIIPAFFEGGRYTYRNVHYVRKGNELLPVAQTPYARDEVFGYCSSNLRNWIEEKTKGIVPAAEVATISIEDLRLLPLENLIEKLQNLEVGTTCIVNAMDYSDLQFFAMGLLQSGVQPLLRTAASFVATMATLTSKPLLTGPEVATPGERGGLVIVGSYVPATTSQLDHLLNHRRDLYSLELDVRSILQTVATGTLAADLARNIDHRLKNGGHLVLYTSRKLVANHLPIKNQEIGRKVSGFLTDIVRRLEVRPAFLITKGGITSSDIATEGLGVQRALVQGQIIKGVPVWKLGTETKFPGLSQVIYPGNVGVESSLTTVIEKLCL